jgi:hypothetical protein
MRKRFAEALTPGEAQPEVPIIGRGCFTGESFTARIAEALGYKRPRRGPDETDAQFLIRRLKPLQFYSRHWANADLESLDPALLELAAMQICSAAADTAQDRVCEPAHRRNVEQEQ